MMTSADAIDAYQIEGAEWLSKRQSALLADEMGLGKTAQIIRALDLVGARRVLVLCPAVARGHWVAELSRYSSRKWTSCAVYRAADSKQTLSAEFVVCSYDLTLTKPVMRDLQAKPWDVCVLDEAHYVRSRDAQRTHAALALAGRAARVWAVTGTPIVRDPSDLFVLLNWFGEWRGSYWDFAHRYCVVRETPFGLRIEPGTRHEAELKAMVDRVMLRRTKAELHLNLPPIVYDRVLVQPSVVQRAVAETYFPGYLLAAEQFQRDIADADSAIRKLLDEVHTTDEQIGILSAISESAGNIKTLRQWIALQKAPAIIDMVTAELEANAYDKIIIFAVHRAMIEELRMGLDKFKPLTIYGGTPAKQRSTVVNKFQTQRGFRVFIGQISAAGTAIDLTAANQVLMAEADWLPANNAQAIMRAHRRTQKRPVSVRWVEMAGSIDERVTRVCRARTKAITEIYDTTPDGVTIDIFAE